MSQSEGRIHARIAGTGSYLPEKVLTNDDLAKLVDTSDEWIAARTGIRERHVAAEGETTSDLAYQASLRALEAAGVEAGELDLIIMGTTTPDLIFPSAACLLQHKLGANGCPAFDVHAACSGFIYALTIADKFIRSGAARTALVVGSETLTRMLDWTDRGTCVLFGDGAGAVILEAASEPGILASALHADGSHHTILNVPGSVACGQVTGDPFLRMDGQAVFRFAVRALSDVALEVIQAASLQVADVDWLIPHQANRRIMQATAKRLGLDDAHVIETVSQHGNTSAASVPLALDLAVRDGRVQRGQRVLLEGVGGGFTWGATLLTF